MEVVKLQLEMSRRRRCAKKNMGRSQQREKINKKYDFRKNKIAYCII